MRIARDFIAHAFASAAIAVCVALAIGSATTPAVASENALWDLLDSPVKDESEAFRAGETIVCTISFPISAALFGAEEIDPPGPTNEFLVSELYSPFRVWHVDENCNIMSTWSTAHAGTTMTGLAITNGSPNTYWVVDPVGAVVTEYSRGTGLPTGSTCPLAVGVSLAGATIDSNRPGEVLCVGDSVLDQYVWYDLLAGCAFICTYANPDNSGSGAFGNAIDDAVDPSSCSGTTLVHATGTISEGQVVRVGQYDCASTPSTCSDRWDVGTPLFFEPFINEVVEFGTGDPCSPAKLLVVGNATFTAYVLDQSTPGPSCLPRPWSLVGFWPLDGDGTDIEGCSNAVPLGSPTAVTGKVACAYSFDGTSQYLEAPDSSCLDVGSSGFGGSGDLSIEAWVRTSSAAFQPILTKRATTPGSVGYTMFLLGGIPRFEICAKDGFSPTLCRPWAGATAVDDGAWHHVAMVVRRGGGSRSGEIWVDGVLDRTIPQFLVPKGNVNGSGALRIGTDRTLNRFFDGDIDEVSLYDAALSATQIQDIYNAGSSGKCR